MSAINDEDDKFTGKKDTGRGWSDTLFMVSQVVVLIIYTNYSKYADGVLPQTSNTTVSDAYNMYACFQDVNVMIFIGFGYLMTYLKAQGHTAVSFNWIASIWAIEWGILSVAFWTAIVKGDKFDVIEIDLTSLVTGLFGAATAMITYGALLGKVSLQQLMFLIWWEMIWWGCNWALVFNKVMTLDMGGSIVIHAFGAYFGLASSYFFQPNQAKDHKENSSYHTSEMFGLVGSVFLWMYWPSFNGVLSAPGDEQNRVFCNTNLAIMSGAIAAAAVSRMYYGKLEMTIILNATLAGGVSIGTASNLITEPATAMWVGFIGGTFSAVAFNNISPFLSNGNANLQDTCGVNSLHGMPGIFGALVSANVIASSAGDRFPDSYFTAGTASQQVKAQFVGLALTLVMSVGTGIIGGFLAGLLFEQPSVDNLFRDDDHIEGADEKYTADQHHKEVSQEE